MALLATLLVLAAPALAQRQGGPGVARPSASALEAARRYLCPNGGTPQRAVVGRRGGRCAPGGGGTGSWGADSDVTGWDRDLPAASRAQAPCPPGTVAAASAQAGAVRCVPG